MEGEHSKSTSDSLLRKVQLLEEELDAAEKNVKETVEKWVIVNLPWLSSSYVLVDCGRSTSRRSTSNVKYSVLSRSAISGRRSMRKWMRSTANRKRSLTSWFRTWKESNALGLATRIGVVVLLFYYPATIESLSFLPPFQSGWGHTGAREQRYVLLSGFALLRDISSSPPGVTYSH